jgi:hypothetical protein
MTSLAPPKGWKPPPDPVRTKEFLRAQKEQQVLRSKAFRDKRDRSKGTKKTIKNGKSVKSRSKGFLRELSVMEQNLIKAFPSLSLNQIKSIADNVKKGVDTATAARQAGIALPKAKELTNADFATKRGRIETGTDLNKPVKETLAAEFTNIIPVPLGGGTKPVAREPATPRPPSLPTRTPVPTAGPPPPIAPAPSFADPRSISWDSTPEWYPPAPIPTAGGSPPPPTAPAPNIGSRWIGEPRFPHTPLRITPPAMGEPVDQPPPVPNIQQLPFFPMPSTGPPAPNIGGLPPQIDSGPRQPISTAGPARQPISQDWPSQTAGPARPDFRQLSVASPTGAAPPMPTAGGLRPRLPAQQPGAPQQPFQVPGTDPSNAGDQLQRLFGQFFQGQSQQQQPQQRQQQQPQQASGFQPTPQVSGAGVNPGVGRNIVPSEQDGAIDLENQASFGPAFDQLLGALLPQLSQGNLTNQPGFTGGLNRFFESAGTVPNDFSSFRQGLLGFNKGIPLQDQISQALQSQIAGGAGGQGFAAGRGLQDVIGGLLGQSTGQPFGSRQAASGINRLTQQPFGGGGVQNVLNTLLGRSATQPFDTRRAGQGLSNLSRGNQLGSQLGGRATQMLGRPQLSSDFGNLQNVQAPNLGLPQAQAAQFQGPNMVGSPNIQGRLQSSLAQSLAGGGLGSDFVSAAREQILQPTQEAAAGRLNQQFGGVGKLSSGLAVDQFNQNERAFNNNLILQSLGALQNAQTQAGQLGQQQFGQGLQNQQLLQQARQQQAGLGQQSNLANLQAMLQTQGLGSGQNIQSQLANQAAFQGQQQFDLQSALQQAQLGGGFQNQLFQQPFNVAQAQGQLGQAQERLNQGAIGMGLQGQQQGFNNLLQSLLAQGQLGQGQQQLNLGAIGLGGQLGTGQQQFGNQQQQLIQQAMGQGIGREQFAGQFGQQNIANAIDFANVSNQFNQGNLSSLSNMLRALLEPRNDPGMAGQIMTAGTGLLGDILKQVWPQPEATSKLWGGLGNLLGGLGGMFGRNPNSGGLPPGSLPDPEEVVKTVIDYGGPVPPGQTPPIVPSGPSTNGGPGGVITGPPPPTPPTVPPDPGTTEPELIPEVTTKVSFPPQTVEVPGRDNDLGELIKILVGGVGGIFDGGYRPPQECFGPGCPPYQPTPTASIPGGGVLGGGGSVGQAPSIFGNQNWAGAWNRGDDLFGNYNLNPFTSSGGWDLSNMSPEDIYQLAYGPGSFDPYPYPGNPWA